MFRKAAILTLGLSVGLLILAKVFLYPDCYSFDCHDDANHAFPGLKIAREALTRGELPTINFYNNFGAPLLGDGLTYPLALQAITYFIFDSPVAMTLNRFLIAILTVFFAFLFFRAYLRPFSSMVCATLIFFNPVSFWYPVHQYQMASPLFFLALHLLDRWHRKGTTRNFLLLCLVSCILIFSVSINLVVFMIPFFAAFSFCRGGFKIKNTAAPTLAFTSGLIFSFYQTLDFAKNVISSARVREGVYDGVLNSTRELFLGVLIPPGEWLAYNYGAQLQITTYLSLPLILLACAGGWLTRKRAPWKRWSLLVCGVTPTLIALYLYVNSPLRLSIPLVKSVDITRVFWFSLPFCFVYVGYFIDYLERRWVPRPVLVFLMLASLSTFLIVGKLEEATDVSGLYFFTWALLLLGSALLWLRKTKWQTLGAGVLITAWGLAQIPIIVRVLGLNHKTCGGTQYSDTYSSSQFQPLPFVELMEKGNRLAAEIHTHKGHDLRIASHGIFGSAARAIVVDRPFGTSLEKESLVTVDQVPYGYYFSRPWQTDKLTRLGIRYLILNHPTDIELEGKGWQRLGNIEQVSLYENPNKPSIAYVAGKENIYLRKYQVNGTTLRLELPHLITASNLVVTLLHRPGFEAKIDGKSTKIETTPEGLIAIGINPSEKVVELRHRPYSLIWVFGCALLSLGLIYMTSLVIRRKKVT